MDPILEAIRKEITELEPEVSAKVDRLNRLREAERAIVEQGSPQPHKRRASLEEWGKKIVELLLSRTSATRAEMVYLTGVPPGSLSAILLRGDTFERGSRGVWKLTDVRRQVG